MTRQTTDFQTRDAAQERGNATIYILIVVALFAALSFILLRQTNTSESNKISSQRMDILVNQVVSYPYQVKQSVDMMIMSGSETSDLDFTLPDHPDYNTPPVIHKVFHPEGGGLSIAPLPPEVVSDASYTNPPPGWYLGRFTNVEWTTTTAQDVILTAFPLSEEVCRAINKKLLGYTDPPPVLGDTIPDLLIEDEYPPTHTIHTGTNEPELTAALCADCENKPSMCVGDASGTRFGFYSIIVNN